MFAIDFTKPYLYKDVVYFHQGNLSTNNTLRCTLNTGGSNNLTGCNIMCTFKLQNSTEISGVGRIIDPLNAIVDLVFPSNALAVGLNKLEILVNRSDGSVAQSPSITYDIWQGLTTGNGIEAETNYPILIQLINSTNEASNKANSALNKANSMITDITDAIDNAYRSANEADIATSNANTKIEEVETAKTEMIKKVDTSIDTMKSDVETAKNEMASKADEKIADVDRALAAGTVDLELKASRDGEESLPARLKRDLYIDEVPVKQRVLNLENMKEMQDLEYSSDKGYAVCEKTGNGTVKDLNIYGKSVINVLPKLSALGAGGGALGQQIKPDSNGVFTGISSNSNYYIYDGEIRATSLLPNSTYTTKGFIEINCETAGTINLFYVGTDKTNVIKSYKLNAGITYLQLNEMFSTNALCNGMCGFYTNGTGTVNSIKYTLMMIQGDARQLNISSYVDGIASVGNGSEIEVLSSNMPYKYNTELVPNVRKNFKLQKDIVAGDVIKNISDKTVIALVFNATTLAWVRDATLNKGDVYVVPNDMIVKTITIYPHNGWNIGCEILLENLIEINDYLKQDKKTPLFKDVDGSWKPILNLRGIDESNCDVIDSDYSKYTISMLPIILNGSQNINSVIVNTNTVEVAIDIREYKIKPNKGSTVDWQCDKLPCMQGSDDIPHIRTDGSTPYGNLKLYLPKSYGSTKDQINATLVQSPITFIGTLANPVEYEINPMYPEAFEDETLMLFKTGPISPRATWKITSNMVGVLGNVKDRVKRMENDFYKYTVTQNRMQLGTTYSSDRTTFRVDTATFTTEKAKQDLDYDLFRLLKHNILVGPQNYDKAEMENMMDFYVSVGKIDYNMWDELYMLIEEQHNPPVEEEAPVI